jgi:hypothetical protein
VRKQPIRGGTNLSSDSYTAPKLVRAADVNLNAQVFGALLCNLSNLQTFVDFLLQFRYKHCTSAVHILLAYFGTVRISRIVVVYGLWLVVALG